MILPLAANIEKGQIIRTIRALAPRSERSRVNEALDLAYSELFSSASRNNAAKTVILFVTSPSDFDPLQSARKLRDAGVKVIVVGIGYDVDELEASSIAGESGQLILIPDPDNVSVGIVEVIDASKPGMNTLDFVLYCHAVAVVDICLRHL